MNQSSQFIFNLYHYYLNLRDTLEYCIDREHTKATYDNRKNVLVNGIKPGSALGTFFENNKEQGEKIKARIEEFLNEVYGDDSSILHVTETGVRVDHTQHIKIFDYVVGLSESLRDILYGHVQYAKSRHEEESIITDLLTADDRLYRCVATMLANRDFVKSFAEFQKVMTESKGQPTPQSNFIVQNEISKYTGFVRFIRQHHHFTDNETLDILDQVSETYEMTEGRRDRRENKPFNVFFDADNKALNEHVAKVEGEWKVVYDKALKEAIEFTKSHAQANEA